MALKGPRVVIEDNITLTCESAASPGVVLCHKSGSAGSGVALGDSAGKADLYASASGNRPVGILMNTVVVLDETVYHRNFHKDVTKTGERCTILRKGQVTTDKVTGTPTPGDTAYLTANGVMTPTLSTTGGLAATPKVGMFFSGLDENGFATVNVNLPVV